MPSIRVIGKNEVAGWRKRWVLLSANRFRNDHAIAGLAAEIRNEFPQGPSGDLQFTRFIRRNLRGCRGPKMLHMASAHQIFSGADWVRLGGWQGISFLASLRASQRVKVIASLTKEGPHHYSTIRMRALRLGITSPRRGRDSRSRSEERVTALQGWIMRLYKSPKLRAVLPPLPKSVEKAMVKSALVALAEQVRAASN